MSQDLILLDDITHEDQNNVCPKTMGFLTLYEIGETKLYKYLDTVKRKLLTIGNF